MSFLVMPAGIGYAAGFLYDEDEDLRCFLDTDELNAWIIVDSSHPCSRIESSNWYLSRWEHLYNGAPVWFSMYHGAVFQSITDGWIYNPAGLAEPYAEKDLDGVTWIGDGWWYIGEKPNATSPTVACTARGVFLNQNSNEPVPALVWKWARWQWTAAGRSNAPYGVYEGTDGAEADVARRLVGVQRYRDVVTNLYWDLSADMLSLDGPDGRRIIYDSMSRLWILGTRGLGEWWQGSNAPSRSDGMTLVPWKHDDDSGEDHQDSERDPLVLEFHSFVSSGAHATAYMAEVARWR